MVCRDGAVEDALAIARVWVSAWQAAYAGLMPAEYLAGLDAEAALPAFERGFRAPVLVLEEDGDIFGFCGYGASRDPDAGPETGEVFAINLHPASWRRGLGRQLLGETQQRLRAQGFSDATLWVLHGNARARQFYEALGWRLDGAEKHDDKLTGFALHEVRYRLDLPTAGTIGYELSRTYPVPPDGLFRALTDPDVLKEVWGVQHIAVDARAGGKAEATYIAGGQDWSFTLTYAEVAPGQRLRWVTHFKSFPAKRTEVTILFKAVATGSELTVRMENFETESERDANRQAWEKGLTTLATILAR